MARDFYADAEALAARLDDSDQGDVAHSLRAEIDGGMTSTEILLGLRWHLLTMLSESPPTDPAIAREAQDLVDGISVALR